MQIFVKGLMGETTTLEVESTDTVLLVKGMIEAKQGILPSAQRLIWSGMQLEDDRTLADYKVGNLATLHLTIQCGPPLNLRQWDYPRSSPDQEFARLRRLADERAGAERAAKARRGGLDSVTGSLVELGGQLNARPGQVKQVPAPGPCGLTSPDHKPSLSQ